MDEDALDSIADDPVAAAKEIRHDYLELRKGYRKNLYQCIVRAYWVADALRSDEEAWGKFIQEKFWTDHRKKRPGMESRADALLHVMVFVFSTGTYDRAWKYAKALKKHFKERVPPHCIEAIIKQEGGIEKMVRAASRQHQDDEEAATKPRKAVAKRTDGQEKEQSPKSKAVKAAQSGGIGKKRLPKRTVKKRGPRKYAFIASKKCGPGIRHLQEG
jgi:hypothetical protein